MIQSIRTLTNTKLSFDILIPYALLHVACLAVLVTGINWRGVAICLGSFYLRAFGLGVGYHRYFAHRSFKTSRIFQFFLAVLGGLAIQRGVLWWAETHRYHHRHADTADDIHSPSHKGFLYAHSGWFIDQVNRETRFSRVSDLARFPELVWLNDWKGYFLPITTYTVLLYLLFGGEGLVWGLAISTIMLWHVTHWIQSMSHSYGGYRRFPNADNSRNHWLLGLVTLGEFHNNHHYSPSSCRQGFLWWEIDVGYYILRALSVFGVVWDLRVPPEHIRQGDMQSPITNTSQT
ncbi:MAG TPA: fatty acid desaturase [Candidatus Saccharimonadales bacterium]|nr:fatty acid desaturase [Candidatus Saccharimonadales bacterium]